MSSLKATAFHEAAHAVAARHMGIHIHKVMIEPHGLTRIDAERDDDIYPEGHIILYLSGAAAERRMGGNADAASTDRALAMDLARRLTGDERQAAELMAKCATRAEYLITSKWAEVTQVADALVKRRTLSGGEVHKLLRKVPKASVGYVDRSPHAECCATCSMFVEPGACTLVAGDINKLGWCRRWDEVK